jgi:hypothetical protein
MDKKTIKLSKEDWLHMGQELGYLKTAQNMSSGDLLIRLKSMCDLVKGYVDKSTKLLTPGIHRTYFESIYPDINRDIIAKCKSAIEALGEIFLVLEQYEKQLGAGDRGSASSKPLDTRAGNPPPRQPSPPPPSQPRAGQDPQASAQPKPWWDR